MIDYGKIRKDKLLEGLIAQAGSVCPVFKLLILMSFVFSIRLAALLNSILADEEELASGTLFNWQPESQAIQESWQWKAFGSNALLFL